MKYAFYVSGKAGRLKNIIETDSPVLRHTKLVVTDSEEALYLREILEQKKIAFEYFDYMSQRQIYDKETNQILSDYLLSHFLKYQIDYCFCFGDHILKGKLLEAYRNRIINFHPSLLPLFPGRNAIDQAMKDNRTILLGNTAHFIDAGIDTGPVIMQSVTNKSYFETGGYEVILNLQLPMLEEIYRKLEMKSITICDGKVKIEKESVGQPVFYFY